MSRQLDHVQVSMTTDDTIQLRCLMCGHLLATYDGGEQVTVGLLMIDAEHDCKPKRLAMR